MDTVLQSHHGPKKAFLAEQKNANLSNKLSIVFGTHRTIPRPGPNGATLDSVPDELVFGGGSVWAESIHLCATLRVNTR